MPKTSRSTEQTPLLTHTQNDDMYERFTPAQKRVVVALVSWSGLIPCECLVLVLGAKDITHIIIIVFVSGSFIPCIPQIAFELDTSAPVVRQVVLLRLSM